MFNPFVPLSRPLLEAFVKAGKMFFVRQTYTQAKCILDKGFKGYFIITHYSDIAFANYHMSAITHDPNRYLYNWDNLDDRKRLHIASGNPEGYMIYSSVFKKDWQKHISANLKQQVKKYIDNSLVWRPGRNETVDIQVFTNYGELFAKLKLRSQEVRVKLADIEKQ